MSHIIKFDKTSGDESLRVAKFLGVVVKGGVETGRHHVENIYIDSQGRGHSCDGARLHRSLKVLCGGDEVGPGWYRVIKFGKTVCWWEKIGEESAYLFPETENVLTDSTAPSESFTVSFEMAEISYLYQKIVRAMKVHYIELSYLKDLCETVDASGVVRIWHTEKNNNLKDLQTKKPIRVDFRFYDEDNFVTALIMPHY